MRFVYYDTETTGIKSEKDRIIEIAAYDPKRDQSFEELINPGIPIPADATAIHGISNEMVESKASFQVVGQKFIEFCGEDAVLVAHNNDSFDVHFLKAECARHGLIMPQWKWLDTLKWARRYRPDLPRHSLQFLREIYGFAANNAHRALDDVMMLYNVFSAMIDDLPTDKVYDLLHKAKKNPNMPFGKYQGKPLQALPKDYIKWLLETGALDKEQNKELKMQFQELKLVPA